MADEFDLDDVAAGRGGFKIIGENAGDDAGIEVALGFDVNGDNVEDILVGADGNDAGGTNAGAAYVVFGTAGGARVNLDTVAAGTGGFKIVGENAGDGAGVSVYPIQDLNDDGRDEVLVGAHRNDAGGTDAGAAYVVFGKASGTRVNLDDVAAGAGGFKITGEAAGDRAGFAVAHSFDLNGDGLDEILLGAPLDGLDNTGAAYVVFGKADGAQVNLDDIPNGIGGFKIFGDDPGDNAGSDVNVFGEQTGNERSEILVGASGVGNNTGADYALFF